MTYQYSVSDLSKFYNFVDSKFKDPSKVSVIFDVSSLHFLESIEFSKKYKNAKIFAFESNPVTYLECVERTKILKISMNPIYHNQCLFSDVDEFLRKNNFYRSYGNTDVSFGTDFIYLNKTK